MKNLILSRRSRRTAFTLIELLFVITVISILAGLVLPLSGVVKKKRMISLVQAELTQIQTAIEAYKAKLGFYPPDNPCNAVLNPLFFELKGTMVTNAGVAVQNAGAYVTLDGSSSITVADVVGLFGSVNGVNCVSGFMNCSKTVRGGDETSAAINFLKAGLRPNQIGRLSINGQTIDAILVCSVPWQLVLVPNSSPPKYGDPPVSLAAAPGQPPYLNPWRYVSSNPTNNATSYDLWADISIKGKIYRISNWSKQPQVLN